MIVYPPLTGNRSVDALLFGTAWDVGAGGAASYSFPGANSLWDPLAYGAFSEPAIGFVTLNGTAREAVRSALAAWSAVAGIGFAEVADDAGGAGDLRFAFTTYGMDGGQIAYAYAPNGIASGGDVWLNARQQADLFADLAPGTLGYFILLHEAGHALGLKHSYEASFLNPATLEGASDSLFDTVMSYSVWPGITLVYRDGAANIDRLPSTPMALDIDALQALYGEPLFRNGGDDLYLYDAAGKYLETIFDTGGNDTIRIAGDGDAVIDLRPGGWSQIGLPVLIDGGAIQCADTVRIYRDTLIENAIGGGGDDLLFGNDLSNLLDGGSGLDTAGYAGMRAGYTAHFAAGSWTVLDNAGADSLDTLANIERLDFSDGTLALDLAGTAGQAYRLYQAAFDRSPDTVGLAWNIRLMDGGLTLKQMAAAFIASAEFIGLQGDSLSDEAYLVALYDNALGRSPDEAGLAGWLDRLADGSWSRADVLWGFSESVENVGLVAPAIQDGIWMG